MDDLFVIDRTGAATAAASSSSTTNAQPDQTPQYETFIPLAIPASTFHKTPATTRPFQSTPRNPRQKKGKGKYKANTQRQPNYGFPTRSKPAAIDWRGRPQHQKQDDVDEDDELIRDYIANLEHGEDGASWMGTRVGDMQGLGVGGFSDDDDDDDADSDNVDVSDMLGELVDSDAESDVDLEDAVVKPVAKKKANRFALPESGVFEELTEMADEELLEQLESEEDDDDDDSDDSDSSLDLGDIYIEGDEDGMDERPSFTGGKSKWNTMVGSSSAKVTDTSRFNDIHNGTFKKRTSEGASLVSKEESDTDEDEDVYGIALNGQPLSKSARRKQAKRDRKQKRDKDRELRNALKEEQARIAHAVAKKKAGAAIDAEITRILHKVNKTIFEFMVPDNSDLSVLTLPAMPGAIRRLVKDMAPMYGLTVTLKGTHGDKQLVLHRNKNSRMPNDWQMVVEKVLSKKGNKVLKGNTWSGKKSGKKQRRGPPGAPDDRTAPRPGDVVGEGAAPISEDNVGLKMMLMMGWTPGKALGASSSAATSSAINRDEDDNEDVRGFGLGYNSGTGLGSSTESLNADVGGMKLMEPISVTVRAKRRGLGAE
ncbi:hypothetical protein HDU99_002884 [Rhizoclosmatium hyalinum]|nr:hypothetical protein HDU99_002884 [Rhizoclosmatium hyalinum]